MGDRKIALLQLTFGYLRSDSQAPSVEKLPSAGSGSAFGVFGIGGERWRRKTWVGYLQSRRQLRRVDLGVELAALFTSLPGRDAKVEVESKQSPPTWSAVSLLILGI